MEKLKDLFVKFRSGNYFLAGFSVFLGIWYLLRYLTQLDLFDAEHLNVILSIEASVATAVLLDQGVKQSATDREILKEILEEEHEIHELQEEVKDHIEDL